MVLHGFRQGDDFYTPKNSNPLDPWTLKVLVRWTRGPFRTFVYLGSQRCSCNMHVALVMYLICSCYKYFVVVVVVVVLPIFPFSLGDVQ